MAYTNKWQFNNKDFESDDIGESKAFVYIITTPCGLKYIGKKNLYSKTKVEGRKNRVTVDSNWKSYYGSSKHLKTLIKDHGSKLDFKRHILSLHPTPGDASHEEHHYIWAFNALEDPTFLNESVGGTWHGQPVSIIERRLLSDKLEIILEEIKKNSLTL